MRKKLNEGWSRTLNVKYIFIFPQTISCDHTHKSYQPSTFSIRIFELGLVILQFMNAKDKKLFERCLKDFWNKVPGTNIFSWIIFCLASLSKTTNIGFRVFYQYWFFFSIKSLDKKSKYFYFPANCCYIFRTILTKR